MKPQFHPTQLQGASRKEIISVYFEMGYSYREIVMSLLCNHGIKLSIRHLKRMLKVYGLKKRQYHDDLEKTVKAIIIGLEGSGRCLGYKAMWKRLKHKHNLVVKRDEVMHILRILDPEGVARRKSHRLKRRNYFVPGPNFIWHIDGYDKLKPYGFAVHGAIDGYSRKILWLEVGPSNNDPLVIANYYLECVKDQGIVPRMVRCDPGTENTTVRYLQTLFRRHDEDAFANKNSCIIGKSTSNQRIEAWWSILRRQCIDFWMCFFKDLRDSGILQDGDIVFQECARYCFTPIIRNELIQVVNQWNCHDISTKRNADGIAGKPDVMFFSPAIYETENYGLPINVQFISDCQQQIGRRRQDCSEEFLELVRLIMGEVTPVYTLEEACNLYVNMINALKDFV